jgi:hypothetical protein
LVLRKRERSELADKIRTPVKVLSLSKLMQPPPSLEVVNWVLVIAQSEDPLVPFRLAPLARMIEWRKTSTETILLVPLAS